jgi:hypothetical protein
MLWNQICTHRFTCTYNGLAVGRQHNCLSTLEVLDSIWLGMLEACAKTTNTTSITRVLLVLLVLLILEVVVIGVALLILVVRLLYCVEKQFAYEKRARHSQDTIENMPRETCAKSAQDKASTTQDSRECNFDDNLRR